MEEVHRELLKKRQKYIQENIILEESLLDKMREKGLFTQSMVNMVKAEEDADKQISRLLDMTQKRGPDAFNKFMECLEEDYPWVVENFKEKEEELINFNARANADVNPEMRRTVREYIKELSRTTRLNIAQQRAMEDFLCRHITIDTNLNNSKLAGNKLYTIHKQLLSVIPLSSLDESDQMDINATLPENVSVETIEKEVNHVIARIHELEALIDSCYEKLGETSKDIDLPDLIHSQHKILLEREIKIHELKNQLSLQARKMRLQADKARRAHEASQRNEAEKEELERSLDTLKTKIQRLQEERQRMAMKIPFDISTPSSHTTSGSSGQIASSSQTAPLVSNTTGPIPTALSSPRTRSSSRRRGSKVSTQAAEGRHETYLVQGETH